MAKNNKKNTLQAALNHLPDAAEEEGKTATAPKRPAEQPAKKLATTPKPPSRRDTVQVAAHLPPTYAKQLRLIAAANDTTNQALIQEALDLLFLKKGKEDLGV